MASTRTQIYLTEEQRAKLDRLMAEQGKTLAELVRAALDAYLPAQSPRTALESTFGVAPEFSVPTRDEWDRG